MNLPVLIKEPNCRYSIGVDISNTEYERKKFTFCIIRFKDKTDIGTLVALEWFYFSKEARMDDYLNSLKEFYECPILIEEG